jgi:Mg/Co/Ni transporter MgtE
VCPRHARYGFATTDGTRQMRCTRHALVYPRVRDRAVRVALVVGTILFLINQLDVVLSGNLTLLVVMKIALTFLVPYSVSTYSALEVNRRR